MADDPHTSTVSQGRLNCAMDDLRALHELAYRSAPSRADLHWYTVWSKVLLEADDAWMAKQPKCSDKNLRVMLAKVQARLVAAEERVKRLRQYDQECRRRLNERERQVAKRQAEIDKAAKSANDWRLAAEGYSRTILILRAQLEEAGIEIDPRCR